MRSSIFHREGPIITGKQMLMRHLTFNSGALPPRPPAAVWNNCHLYRKDSLVDNPAEKNRTQSLNLQTQCYMWIAFYRVLNGLFLIDYYLNGCTGNSLVYCKSAQSQRRLSDPQPKSYKKTIVFAEDKITYFSVKKKTMKKDFFKNSNIQHCHIMLL